MGKRLPMSGSVYCEETSKKTSDFIQIVGAVFLTITILLRVQLDRKVPAWCTIVCLFVVAAAFIFKFAVSKNERNL